MDEFVNGLTGVLVYEDPVEGWKYQANFRPHMKTKDQWDQTIKECVR